MRILIDLQGAQSASRLRGIGRFSCALTTALIRHAGEDEIYLLLNRHFADSRPDIEATFGALLPPQRFIEFDFCAPVDELDEKNAWRVRAAEVLREKLIADLQPDIMLVMSLFEGGADQAVCSLGTLERHVPTAVVLHDLIPLKYPERYLAWKPGRDWYLRKFESFRRADLLLAVSESARREAEQHLMAPRPEIAVILEAAAPGFSRDAQSAAERREFVDAVGVGRPFVLYASAFDPRKNFDGLVRAWRLLPVQLRATHQLVIVSNIDVEQQTLLRALDGRLPLTPAELLFAGHVDDATLVALYCECALFVFPSLHEGFGLPVLEAMGCGAVVIGARSSSIPEVVGRDDALFDPTDPADIAACMQRALTDTDWRAVMRAHAAVQVGKFSWDATARLALGAMRRYVAAHPRKPRAYAPEGFRRVASELGVLARDFDADAHDLARVAEALLRNDAVSTAFRAGINAPPRRTWRIEGPFDSTYSLALVNREVARALKGLGQRVVLHSTEGPGDFPADAAFLARNPDLAAMHGAVGAHPPGAVDYLSRNLYPPRVADMPVTPVNLLHNYAWEESGFPQDWVRHFNRHLQGITCTSAHVEKVLVDNGVHVPISNVGNGVDHWERIAPDRSYVLPARAFRFLHVSSCFPRKGAELLIEAFESAFNAGDDVSLVIKTFANPHNRVQEQIAERRAANPHFPDVRVIEGDLGEPQLKSLYEQCQVLVAPSKAEGYGLPIAEAMLSGLPAITTAWSGQLDFCTSANAWLVDYDFERTDTHFGLYASVWARARVPALAQAMRDAWLAGTHTLERMAARGRETLLKNWTWRAVAERQLMAAEAWRAAPASAGPLRVGCISTWNTRCGIATYSQHLLRHLQGDVVVLAPQAAELLQPDSPQVRRCWVQGKEGNGFESTQAVIDAESLDAVVIQFNYGFFQHRELASLIDRNVAAGRVVVLLLHSTLDPLEKHPPWNYRLEAIAPSLRRAQRVLVHAVSDLNRLKAIGVVDNVTLFPHGIDLRREPPALALGDRPTMIATYGFALPHKGLLQLLEAAAMLLAAGTPVRLRFVNAEYPAPESAQTLTELRRRVSELGIEAAVELHNEFLEDEASLRLLSEADLVVFAYQETGESASGAVRYGLAAGRPVVVSPLAIFDDLGEAVFRLPGTAASDIAHGLALILPQLRQGGRQAGAVAAHAHRWREQHDYRGLAERLLGMLRGLRRQTPLWRQQYTVGSGRLRTDIGVVDGTSIRTAGRAGCLMHGPYARLPAGRFRGSLLGRVPRGAFGAGRIDACFSSGRQVLVDAALGDALQPDGSFAIEFELRQPCDDVEIRVWCEEFSAFEINSVVVEAIPAAALVPALAVTAVPAVA